MSQSDKIHFRSIEELKNSTLTEALSANEFQEELPLERLLENDRSTQTSRRDFLKFLGFSTAAVTLAACEAPIIKSIPYVVKPEGIIPGNPNYYASTFFDGFDFASVLVKTREGRPIKIEPNKESPLFSKTNARVQAALLSLYDDDRVKTPKLKEGDSFSTISWPTLDRLVKARLEKAQAEGKKIVILTPSYPSPSTDAIIDEFKSKYPNTQRIVFDSVSFSDALDAAEMVMGKRALPLYDLDKARYIVSFQSDFLNDTIGGHLMSGYAKAKTPGPNMVKHVHVEANMSTTGALADIRIPLKPSETYKILAEVYEALNGGTATNPHAKAIVADLQKFGSQSVVFADGSKEAHALALAINGKLNSECIRKDKLVYTKSSNDAQFEQFLDEALKGQVGAVLNFNTNPVYAYNDSEKVQKALSKVTTFVHMGSKLNETAQLAKFIAPVPHWLESWGDFMPATGFYTLCQPTIQRIYQTRSFQDTLMRLSGNSTPYYNYLKNFYTAKISQGKGFTEALYYGFDELPASESISFNPPSSEIVNKLKNQKSSDMELVLYASNSLGDGTQANNPWLQELPDPISRVSWDNYLSISPADAENLGLNSRLDGKMALEAQLVDVTVQGKTLENVPVFVQPGQAKGTVAIAIGYGQKGSGKVAETGVNAFKLAIGNSFIQSGVKLSSSKGWYEMASMQLQNTLMGRYEIAREVTNSDFINKDSREWNPPMKMENYTKNTPIGKVDLWQSFDTSDGPHFNLSIDMNSCIACGACVVACQAENNVPVVGKDEIRRSRDMYWLRIDRYYTAKKKITVKDSIVDGLSEPEQYKLLIEPEAENPEVIFQPVMCQHCEHAPCETVCPVAATSHGKQGQNQMAYNRCVGTRYCANNCPYKVRRFNWFNYALNDKFDYHMNSDLGRMVLNPDVAVRSRGVMEKCSFCIQMTQKTILEAKKEGRKVKDGEFQTACTNACTTGALQFGDVNDPESIVKKLSTDKRRYTLLEELGTKPNVFYHYKVRNK